MKKTLKYLLAVVSIFNLPLSIAHAQQEETYNESVLVKGSFRPVIEQAEKVFFPAVMVDTLTHFDHSFQYIISPTRLKSLYEPTRIKAARILGEPSTKLYNNYLRLGMGNYWTPMADLYWSSTRDTKKTYGVRINHRSSWGTLPDYGKNHFGLTTVTLFGKYLVADKLQLSTDLNYEHDHNLYYGFTDSTLQAVLGKTRDDISVSDYTASYNMASWNFGLRNMELDVNKLGYAADVHLSDLWTVWGANELNFTLSGDVHYGFPMLTNYKGVAYMHVEWEHYRNVFPDSAAILGSKSANYGLTSHKNLIRVNPYVDFLFRSINIHAGLLFAWDGTTDKRSKIAFFPDVTISKKYMDDNLVLSLAATGGLEANTLNRLRLVNPYIAPDAGGIKATSHYDFIGHARWTLSRKLEANAEVSYSLRESDLSFRLDPRYGLNNVYQEDYHNLNRLTIGADIAFVNDEMLTLRAGGHYYHYKYTGFSLNVPWRENYHPDWDLMVSAKVNYNDKWLFFVEGQMLSKMKADGGEELPMRYGINAEVEYRHNRALSFFLKMDNLAFQRYYYWANYPSQRGLFILGLTYTVPHK